MTGFVGIERLQMSTIHREVRWEDWGVSSRPERLLSGPRGRRLCLELAMAADPAVCTAAFALAYQLDPGQGLSRVLLTFESDQDFSEPGDGPAPTVAGLVSAVGALGARRVEPGLIQFALQRSVDFARYWQEPDGEDRLAALPEIATALLPLAEAVVESAEVAWWSQAFSTDQWLVQWQTSGGETIPQTPISLTAWSEELELPKPVLNANAHAIRTQTG